MRKEISLILLSTVAGMGATGIVMELGWFGHAVRSTSGPRLSASGPRQQSEPDSKTLTVVHKHVLSVAPGTTPEETATALSQPEPPVADPIAEMDAQVESAPADRVAESRNESAIKRIIGAVGEKSAYAMKDFRCRGNHCRASLSFKSVDDARTVLNALPANEEWRQGRFGFNALPEIGARDDAPSFVIHFYSDGPVSESTRNL